MITHTQKIEAERRMRELLESEGLPQPDRVEYGVASVRFFFGAAKQVVVIDLDDPAEEGGDAGECEAA